MIDCFSTINLIPILKGRYMLVQSPYDQWCIQNILTVNCTTHAPSSL